MQEVEKQEETWGVTGSDLTPAVLLYRYTLPYQLACFLWRVPFASDVGAGNDVTAESTDLSENLQENFCCNDSMRHK